MDVIPIDQLRIQAVRSSQPTNRPKRRTRPFVRGPIDLQWLHRAAVLPGRALHVGLALHYLVGVERSHTVKLRRTVVERFGVNRHAEYRALRVLEAAGLVSVQRKPGARPIVTLVPVPAPPPGEVST